MISSKRPSLILLQVFLKEFDNQNCLAASENEPVYMYAFRMPSVSILAKQITWSKQNQMKNSKVNVIPMYVSCILKPFRCSSIVPRFCCFEYLKALVKSSIPMDLESKSLALLGLAGSDDNRKSCPKLCTERMRHTLSQLILRACVGSVCVGGQVDGCPLTFQYNGKALISHV